jgi:hypothetical protein
VRRFFEELTYSPFREVPLRGMKAKVKYHIPLRGMKAKVKYHLPLRDTRA